jgi:predicted nucleotidyltransferase
MALSPPKNVMTPPVADIGDPDRRPGEMKTEAMLAARLAAHPEVRRVILFGSRARGTAAERADVDLAIEAPGASARQWLDLLAELDDAPTLLSIDAVRLEEAPAPLRSRIAAEGRVLYERGT